MSKPLAAFKAKKTGKYGLDSRCRDCYNAYRRARFATSQEVRDLACQRGREWRQKHAGTIEYKLAQREKAKNRTPEGRQAIRKRAAEKAGKVYRTTAEVEESKRFAYETLMRRKLVSRRRARIKRERTSPTAGMTPLQRYRWRMANDPAYVINMRMRNAIRKALRGQKAGRRWESLVGYTLADLTQHLARQMPKGYSLADIGSGRIHIDHIVPKVGYDVTKPEELRAAWCLSNLRPLTATENLRKGAHREFLL